MTTLALHVVAAVFLLDHLLAAWAGLPAFDGH